MKSGKTRILLLASGGGGVPLAGAYANRIVSMAKGLTRREDVSIKLWFVFLGNHNLQSQEGIYEGIPYEYMVDPEFKRNRVTTPFVHLYGMLKAACLIAFRKKEFDVAIAFFHSLLSIPVWLAARITGLPIIRELNEFPASIQDSGEERCSLAKHLFDKLSLMPFVGFISITNRLGRYLNELFPSKPIIIVPINVQPERFSVMQAQRSNYITYAGAISNQKDGIGYLITAFAIIAKTHPDLRMKLVGGYTSEEDENIVVELIRKYSLEALIELTGWVTRDEAAKHILQSLVLVLPRPDSIQASGGFPTKLVSIWQLGSLAS
jgi:glycosyltransferase involved in cell wall biosynthesis